MNKSRILYALAASSTAVVGVFVAFGVISLEEGAAVAGAVTAFLTGYRTYNPDISRPTTPPKG